MISINVQIKKKSLHYVFLLNLTYRIEFRSIKSNPNLYQPQVADHFLPRILPHHVMYFGKSNSVGWWYRFLSW